LTVDVDLVIRLDRENASKTVDALTALGYAPRAPVDPKQFADPKIRASWIAQKGLTVFSFFNKSQPYFEVDLFVDYPMDFDELMKRSVVKALGPLPVRIAGIQDLEDIRILEEIKSAGLG
jgi:hypothetical protein